jgi:uncharacterized protein (DUF983 family)
MPPEEFAPVSSLRVAVVSRCPRCGQGKLYDGFLEVADRCSVCDLRLGVHDVGDAASVLVILIIGFAVVGLALAVEMSYAPPLWVHAVLWPPLILGGALGLLRFAKSLFIALHFRHRADDFDVAD